MNTICNKSWAQWKHTCMSVTVYLSQKIPSVILTTDESTHSTLSVDSCEYYQTEIFDQLPSIQASRPGPSRQDSLEASEAYQGSTEPRERLRNGHLSRGSRDKVSVQPLRNLAMCIQAKRRARWESFFISSSPLLLLNLILKFKWKRWLRLLTAYAITSSFIILQYSIMCVCNKQLFAIFWACASIKSIKKIWFQVKGCKC